MGRITEADDAIRTRAGIGGNGGLLVDVFPADKIHTHLNARLLGKARCIGAEHFFIRLHEAHWAQDAERRPIFNRKARRSNTAVTTHLALREGLATGGKRGHANTGTQDTTTSYDICHVSTP